MQSIFGEVISAYTREQAIQDGVLIDVTETAKEAGFRVPVAITKAVYEGYVVPSAHDERYSQDKEGRLWDTIWMLRVYARTSNGARIDYPVIYIMDGEQKEVELKALSHAGDNGEHVITIMLPEED